MALWLVLEVSLLFIFQATTIIDPTSQQFTASTQESNEDPNFTHNKNEHDVMENDQHHRLLHDHMVNTLDEINREELNEQLSILSRQQKEHNDQRLEKLDEIVKSLQVNDCIK